MGNRGWRLTVLGGALSSMAAVAIACGGGGASEADLTAAQNVAKEKEAQLAAAQSQLTASQSELTAAKSQLAAKDGALQVVQKQLAGMAPSTIVQTGQLQPAPAGAKPSGWDTAASIKGGMTLYARYDSSGPDAYDVAKHPLVYASSEGMAKAGSPGKNEFAGVYVMDASTKEVVASARFDLGYKHTGAGHTVGISPDGKWFYIGTTVEIEKKSTPLVLIVNARTLKLDKALKGTGISDGFALHHSIGFTDAKGNDRVTLTKNSGPGFILDPKDDNRVVMAITAQDVAMLGHNYVTVDPAGKFLYWALRPSSWGNEHGEGGLAKINLESGAVTYIWGLGEGANPLGMAHTADGKFTYINDAHGDAVYKIDNATNEIVGKTNAGVAGPYGLTLNWDETQLYTIGKGEGSHNTGHVIGVIDTGTKPGTTFRPDRSFNQPIVLGGSAKSIDHGILNPDPKVNELWVSNMAGWETIVLDLNTREVKAYIPTPNGGDTHSGGFIRYKADWTGVLLNDMGGPKAEVYAAKSPLVAAAAAKK